MAKKKHYSVHELAKLKKATLLKKAKDKKVLIPKGATKEQIIKKIHPISATCSMAGRETRKGNKTQASNLASGRCKR